MGVQLILLGAGLSSLTSIYLWFFVSHDYGVFVGIWVPSIPSFGTLIMLSVNSSA